MWRRQAMFTCTDIHFWLDVLFQDSVSPPTTYHLGVTVERSQIQRCAAVLVRVVGGSAALHQIAHDGQVTLQTGPTQSGQALFIHQRQRGSWKTQHKPVKTTKHPSK